MVDATRISEEWRAKANAKLQGIIDRGREKATAALQQVQANQPADIIVPTPALDFRYDEGLRLGVRGKPTDDAYNIHDHALGQVCDKAGVPRKWMDRLTSMGGWGEELLVHNLREMYGHMDESKHLVRVVGGQVRGFLSDRYKRIDTPLIAESFSAAISKYGAVPIEAHALDTKFTLKAALPQVVEPIPGEPMILGVSLKNSDFGDGAFELRMFLMRIWCTNMAVCEDGLRRVHIGSRIAQDYAMSQRTYELDNKAMASATDDVVTQMLEPASVRGKFELVRQAAETKVDIKAALDAARKRGSMNIKEAKEVTEIYNTGGIELLPPGDNAWRLSNAISFFAQKVPAERKLDLEVLAGQVAGLHG